MATIIIQVPGKAQNKSGEIISISSDKQASKKARLINEIKQGLKEVKEIREGKAKSYSMADLFNFK